MTVDPTFKRWADSGLVWLPERGMGWFDVPESAAPYDTNYFAKYERYAETDMGRAITAARVALVRKWAPYARLVDVGIGCGAFVEAMLDVAPNRVYGYDVNPAGVVWLKDRRRWLDPYEQPVEACSMWDVLEHIKTPAPLLANVRHWLFISIPLFDGPEHVLRSKHYRRDEHALYFTRAGLLAFMDAHGFRCVEHNTMESLLGREDIHTFVFRRERDPAACGPQPTPEAA